MDAKVESLQNEISQCESRLAALKQELAETEARQNQRLNGQKTVAPAPPRWPLSLDEYERYGRQMILPEIGLEGQIRLKNCKILIIGVGGLGCPAAAYLAGAGVGTLGLVDGDVVEQSNLHRQILHSTSTIGTSKVESARRYIQRLNPLITTILHAEALTPQAALLTVSPYNLVLDCTDTPATRYLVSDACVLLRKPLVTASALRADGQLALLNWPPSPVGDPTGGPCYRCVFPIPPPPEAVTSCGEGGVLGPAVGVMGVLQAMEALKLIANSFRVEGKERWYYKADGEEQVKTNTMLLFSGHSSPAFRSIRLRTRRSNCKACSAVATVNSDALSSGSLDYVQFCGGVVGPVNALQPHERVRAHDVLDMRQNTNKHVLVDVREKVQFDLCRLEGSINIPWSEIATSPADTEKGSEVGWVKELRGKAANLPIYVVCRLGNDSQLAVGKMKKLGLDEEGRRWIGDVVGGLKAWRKEVDQGFPDY